MDGLMSNIHVTFVTYRCFHPIDVLKKMKSFFELNQGAT